MSMRSFRLLNLAILSVLVGSAALVYAQDEKPQEEKPAHQEEAKPQPKQDEAKPAHPDEAKPSKQEEKQDEKRMQEQSHEQALPNKQEHPEQPAEHAQGHPEQAHGQPAGKGGHIPDDKFRAHFGRSHTFTARTVIVSGQPQFQYSGYSFQLVDVWPVGWAYTDECYIDYIDGEYFLFDLLHPGIRVAVFVVM
jgi:hypothetical protein